jgi:hypothetical protein
MTTHQFSGPAPTRNYKRKGAPVASTENAAGEKVGGVVHRTTPQASETTRGNSGLQYVALKPMKVEGVKVNPGDIVPQANTWRNVHNYLSSGHLAVVGA